MKNFILILLALATFQVYAQSTKVFDKKWELAKGHYSDGNYDMAVMLFSTLSSENAINPYVEYANYYTALSEFKRNNLKQSRAYLMQLQNKYPNWEKIEDARYLHANIEFIFENYPKAMELLDSNNSKESVDLKLHYLSKIPSFHLLSSLLQNYPDDKEIATIYCYQLAAKKPLFESDKEEIELLLEKHNIKGNKLKNLLNNSSQDHFKDTFNIALIYPFYLKNISNLSSQRKNQFVLDHYLGLKNAVDTLTEMGINIKVHAYDSKNDTNEVNNILAKAELKKMDILVGSIYRNNMKLISSFATDNQIICFNPMSNYSSTIQDSGFVYMYNPSFESIGKSAAEFVMDSFANKRILLLSFENFKDTTIGSAFVKRLAQDSIKVAKKIIIPNGQDVLKALSKVKRGSIDVVFAPATNTSIGTNLISWLIMRETDIPVIGNSKWLESREYNINNANQKTAYFFDENYINYSVDSTWHFKDKYFNANSIPPTDYAYKGFELGMFLGRNLSEHGKYFNQALWNMGSQDGILYPKFNYKNSYTNNFVPILRLKDYQLVPANYSNQEQKEESTDGPDKQ